MIASREDWIKATENLNERRQWKGVENHNLDKGIELYRTYLSICGFGYSVLDVGCGSQTVKRCLPESVKYIGVDAFPLSGIDCISTPIEELTGIEVDTVVAFAVLDNCQDFFKACESMKRIAKQNVIILSGIGIEVDKFHTFKLEHDHFKKAFQDWEVTVYEQVSPKVWLMNFEK